MTTSPDTPQLKEHLTLTVAPKSDSGPSGIIEKMAADLRDSLPGLLADLTKSGRGWVKGKSDQEAARAKEILSNAIERIGRLALDEQDQRHRHRLESANQDAQLQAVQLDLYFTSMERAVAIVRSLADMGVDVDLRQLLNNAPGFQLSSVELNHSNQVTDKP